MAVAAQLQENVLESAVINGGQRAARSTSPTHFAPLVAHSSISYSPVHKVSPSSASFSRPRILPSPTSSFSHTNTNTKNIDTTPTSSNLGIFLGLFRSRSDTPVIDQSPVRTRKGSMDESSNSSRGGGGGQAISAHASFSSEGGRSRAGSVTGSTKQERMAANMRLVERIEATSQVAQIAAKAAAGAEISAQHAFKAATHAPTAGDAAAQCDAASNAQAESEHAARECAAAVSECRELVSKLDPRELDHSVAQKLSRDMHAAIRAGEEATRAARTARQAATAAAQHVLTREGDERKRHEMRRQRADDAVTLCDAVHRLAREVKTNVEAAATARAAAAAWSEAFDVRRCLSQSDAAAKRAQEAERYLKEMARVVMMCKKAAQAAGSSFVEAAAAEQRADACLTDSSALCGNAMNMAQEAKREAVAAIAAARARTQSKRGENGLGAPRSASLTYSERRIRAGSAFSSGIGLRIDRTEAGHRVCAVLPSQPAHRAGIALGDVIVAVNGQSVAHLTSLGETIASMETPVLTVRRENQAETVDVEIVKTSSSSVVL